MSVAAGDTAMARRLLVEMSTAEQTQYLEGIRERRLAAVARHQELVAAKDAARDEKLRAMIEKEVVAFDKDIVRLTALEEKIQGRMSKASALIAMQRSEV